MFTKFHIFFIVVFLCGLYLGAGVSSSSERSSLTQPGACKAISDYLSWLQSTSKTMKKMPDVHVSFDEGPLLRYKNAQVTKHVSNLIDLYRQSMGACVYEESQAACDACARLKAEILEKCKNTSKNGQ